MLRMHHSLHAVMLTLLFTFITLALLVSVCIEMLSLQTAFSRTTRLAGPCLADMLSSVASSRAVALSFCCTHRSNTTVKSITLRRPIWLMHRKQAVKWTLCTMTSLSMEVLPAQCIVHFVLVKMLLCRHYPTILGLRFVGVSQELAVSPSVLASFAPHVNNLYSFLFI